MTDALKSFNPAAAQAVSKGPKPTGKDGPICPFMSGPILLPGSAAPQGTVVQALGKGQALLYVTTHLQPCIGKRCMMFDVLTNGCNLADRTRHTTFQVEK